MSHRFNLVAVVAVLLAVSGQAKQLRTTRDLVNAEEVSKIKNIFLEVQFVVTCNTYDRKISTCGCEKI